MIVWLRSILARRSSAARRLGLAMVAVVLLGVAAAVLTPAPHPRQPGHVRSAERPGSSTGMTLGAERRSPPVSALELVRAREVAARFLESYLPFIYGRSPLGSVVAIAPGLRRQLGSEHAEPTPAERRRHPRVVSLQALGEAPDVVLASALIDDGGITNYPLRITLREGRDGWLVSGVDEG